MQYFERQIKIIIGIVEKKMAFIKGSLDAPDKTLNGFLPVNLIVKQTSNFIKTANAYLSFRCIKGFVIIRFA